MFVNLLGGEAPPTRVVRLGMTVTPHVSVLRIMINRAFGASIGLHPGGRASVSFGVAHNAGLVRVSPSPDGYVLSSKARSRDLLLQVARHPDYLGAEASVASTAVLWELAEGALVIHIPPAFCRGELPENGRAA